MKLNMCKQIVATALIAFAFSPVLVAQTEDDASPTKKMDPTKKALYEKFEKTMSGAKLVGNFTLLNAKPDQKLQPEEYVIGEVKKLDKGEMWMFKARIKYGGKDVSVPLPLEVQWAGDTPVITLTDFAVPTMGTFSARVVIYNKKYAGTWSHGKEGGHLFGKIVSKDDAAKADDAKPENGMKNGNAPSGKTTIQRNDR